MEEKNQFMKEAIRLAGENLISQKGGPFGAVIVKNGEIIGRGANTVVEGNDPTAHAEINAIREACTNLGSYQLDGCEIYTSCEPCPMCLGAIYWARPSKIYFAADRHDAEMAGFDDSLIYQEIKAPIADRQIPLEQLMKAEAAELFQKWNNLDKKVEY
ncbi:MAG TPA: nucleoside deaminase [Bacteroidales bacterium]|nr:nucleoside deaminase [Bacteroidales bacterium]HPE58222.1 nucleoside deaminase [Bacteroidales bacterium]